MSYLFKYTKILTVDVVSDNNEAVFGHLFLILEWNMMTRTYNVVHLHINHLEWRDACWLCYIIQLKGGQEGANSKESWYIYANPKESKIYPVLSLACYLPAYYQVVYGNKVFMSTDSYQQFSKILWKYSK